MKIVIITGSKNGLASHHLPYLIHSNSYEIALVIYNEGTMLNKKKYYLRKIKKAFKIGIWGAFNGIRMRKWYSDNLKNHLSIKDLPELCSQLKIPFSSVKSLNSTETVTLLQQTPFDLGISLGNGYISSKIFSVPKHGMINIHHEILPDYQNAQSVIWQLYNNSTTTGYTIHKIDKDIDTGAILFQEKIPIDFGNSLGETVSQTYANLFEASANGLAKVLENFNSYNNHSYAQKLGKKYTTPSFWQFLKITSNFKKLATKDNF